MAFLGRLFYSSTTTEVVETAAKDGSAIRVRTAAEVVEISGGPDGATQAVEVSAEEAAQTSTIPLSSKRTSATPSYNQALNSPTQEHSTPQSPDSESSNRRFSFRRLSFSSRKSPHHDKAILSVVQEHERKEDAIEAEKYQMKKEKVSKSDLRARKHALRARMLITGEPTGSLPAVSPVVAKPQLNKIKSQLSEPKTANKLIKELRRLPATGVVKPVSPTHGEAPIHAVCLEFTEAEEESIHFARLNCTCDSPDPAEGGGAMINAFPSVVSAPVEQLTALLNDMHVVELIKAPDLGLGQPGDGEGILAGAVPTPETVLNGMKEITPQLLALGYATGRALLPDHSGVYPPTDRMSVLTYWWGLEVVLPPPSLEYLSRAQSTTGAIVNFLSAMALVNNGVKEILPFVRYIAQFIEFEFNSIKSQDNGQGVVCAATWIMPAALVPRPWDFPIPPTPALAADNRTEEEEDEEEEDLSPLPVPQTPSKRLSAAPSLPKPRPVSSILDIVSKPASPKGSTGNHRAVSGAPSSPNTPPAPVVSVQA